MKTSPYRGYARRRYGWLATESSREFWAAAVSWTRNAPRTPVAPGSREAPSTLSRSRSVAGGLGWSFVELQAAQTKSRTMEARTVACAIENSGWRGV